jgi:hypothetical protein
MAHGAGYIDAWLTISEYISREDVAELESLDEADVAGALMTMMVSADTNPLEPDVAEEILIRAQVLEHEPA